MEIIQFPYIYTTILRQKLFNFLLLLLLMQVNAKLRAKRRGAGGEAPQTASGGRKRHGHKLKITLKVDNAVSLGYKLCENAMDIS